MKYFEYLVDNIITNKESLNIQEELIHPYSFISFCDFVYCENRNIKNKKTLDISLLKDNDSVFIDSKSFDGFVDKVLPEINKKINIVTARALLPQVKKTKKTELVLNNKNISIWFAQNPVYENISNYIPIPYGLKLFWGTKIYLNSMINNLNLVKTKPLSHLSASVHKHLPKDHIRRNPQLGYSSKKRICLNNFYNAIAESFFTISLSGDRHDCHRHYESIGLGTIPVSNIPAQYQNIFGDSMILNKTTEDIIDLISNGCNYHYKEPNRDIITTKYWHQFFLEKIY